MTGSIENKFLCEASGYQFVQLTSYTYFGGSEPANRAHYILTDSTGEVVYAYIGAFDPEDCNNKSGMTGEHDENNFLSFYFLMDAAIEGDIVELRPYALAGVKGMINIPDTVEIIGEYCFKDCEPEGNFLNIFIGNSDCAIDEKTFDETARLRTRYRRRSTRATAIGSTPYAATRLVDRKRRKRQKIGINRLQNRAIIVKIIANPKRDNTELFLEDYILWQMSE